MKVLVGVKRVVDPNVPVRVKSDESGVELANVKMAINPFCEIAVEQAVRLKESGEASEVIAVSIGPKACQEQLRSALALGADKAIHIETETAPESLHVAKLLAKLVERDQPGLVLLGKQAIDSDNNQTGQMLAALCDLPQATFASEVSFKDEKLHVTREVDGGLQTLAVSLPAVVTTDLRLNEPRFASLPNIMKAKRKPLESLSPADLDCELKPHLRLLKVTAPASRSGATMVDSVETLIEKLQQEAKVI